MKIAVAVEGKFVSGHFGHCEGFNMFEVQGDKIIGSNLLENPGHKPGFLPVFLKEHGADVIIAGGMGGTAQDLFAQNGIKVVVGAQGEAEKVVELYLKGQVQSTGSVCTAHEHEGHCND